MGIGEIDGGDNVCILGGPRFRLRSRKRVPLQGPLGVTDTLVLFLFLHVIHVSDYLAVVPSLVPGAGSWSRVCTGPTKIQTMSPTDQFQ